MSATIVRALVWLVFLGMVTMGLTVCSVPTTTLVPPTRGEVAAPPSPTPRVSADTVAPPSPTPAPETDTPPPPTDTLEPPSPTPPPPTDTPEPATDTPEAEAEAAATDTPEPGPEASPTDTPEPEPEAEEVDVASLSSDNCISCHTDEATLQELAEEKEVKSEATSGEG